MRSMTPYQRIGQLIVSITDWRGKTSAASGQSYS
jgi:hypothetical protein